MADTNEPAIQSWDIHVSDDGKAYSLFAPDGSWRQLNVQWSPGDKTVPTPDDAAKQARDAIKSDPKLQAQFLATAKPVPTAEPPSQEPTFFQKLVKNLPGGDAPGLGARLGGVFNPTGGGLAYQATKATMGDTPVPDTWAGKAALATAALVPALRPFLGPNSPLLARFLANQIVAPTVAGTTAGAIAPNETAAEGAETGLATGLVGKGAELGLRYGGKLLTGVGQTAKKLGSDLYAKVNQIWSPNLGPAIEQSIPSLGKVGIRVTNANDMYNLVDGTAQAKVGKLLDPIEGRIKTVLAGETIDVPVLAKTTEATTQATTTKSTQSQASTSRTATSKSTTKPSTDKLIVPPETEPLSGFKRVQTLPGPDANQTSSNSTSKGQTAASSTSASKTAGESSRTSVSKTSFPTQPMTAEQAIEQMRQYRYAAQSSDDPQAHKLYNEATNAIDDAIQAKAPGLAKLWNDTRTDYRNLMDFKRVFGSQPDKVFPALGNAAAKLSAKTGASPDVLGGRGINPAELAQRISNYPDIMKHEGASAFDAMFKFLRGNQPKGSLPEAFDRRPPGGYFHTGFLPSFRLTAGWEGKGVQLDPAMAAALARHPELGRLIQNGAPVAGGVGGGALGQYLDSLIKDKIRR